MSHITCGMPMMQHPSASESCVDLSKLELSDAEIEFRDVLGLEAFSPKGQDLSHGSIETSGAFLERTCKEAEEPVSSYRCFVFWSASPVRPILRIVAAEFDEERVHAA